MLKNGFVGGSKIPHKPKTEVQEAINTTSSEDLNVSPLFPLELDLSLYRDCSELPYPCLKCNPSNTGGSPYVEF